MARECTRWSRDARSAVPTGGFVSNDLFSLLYKESFCFLCSSSSLPPVFLSWIDCLYHFSGSTERECPASGLAPASPQILTKKIHEEPTSLKPKTNHKNTDHKENKSKNKQITKKTKQITKKTQNITNIEHKSQKRACGSGYGVHSALRV